MRRASPPPSRPAPVQAAPRPAPRPAQTQPAPVAQQPTAVAQPMPSAGGGLLGQMAATAGGVAIGHTLGHALTGAFSGGSGGEVAQAAPAQAAPLNEAQARQYGQNPCEFETKQFLDCTQNQFDITLCEGFNQVLKECKARTGMTPGGY